MSDKVFFSLSFIGRLIRFDTEQPSEWALAEKLSEEIKEAFRIAWEYAYFLIYRGLERCGANGKQRLCQSRCYPWSMETRACLLGRKSKESVSQFTLELGIDSCCVGIHLQLHR